MISAVPKTSSRAGTILAPRAVYSASGNPACPGTRFDDDLETGLRQDRNHGRHHRHPPFARERSLEVLR